MAKDTSISIRVDSELKKQTEQIMAQFGLNMTSVINMLFHQIVREKAIPLSLSLNPSVKAVDELLFAKQERLSGYIGRTSDDVADEIERVITDVEDGRR